uniref:Uncharacterized protein n=1 Tax=Meloidogyne enterolobii TaxID=390850 RepID=A0A6V7X7Z3_MELEN|nr:unnamed protein product [Meloidogyne enterolobii]
MRTPKQLENSDNTYSKNKIGDETLVEDLKELNEISETSSIDGLSSSCGSCCLSQNIIESLKQNMEKLELKLKNNSLEIINLKLEKKIQKMNSDCEHENEIKNLKQYFQQLIEENIEQLKVENYVYLKQKDEKINSLEEEIKKVNCRTASKILTKKSKIQKNI